MVMSSLLTAATIKRELKITSNHVHSNQFSRHILKSKENTLRHKCSRALRRKLKKYKLRHDGKEDPDVLDVSQTLITLLKIKSPKNQNHYQNSADNADENLPKNYLFKMGRRKQVIKTSETIELNTRVGNTSFDKNEKTSPLHNNEEKQETNAFKLMMDSRNKSIGSNSPGKEKNSDEIETTEITEKKVLKAKRNLALQKMAEAKGSLKKKELEECQEKYIKNKMEERAERLKNLIVNIEKKVIKTENKTLKSVTQNLSKVVQVDNDKHNVMETQKTLTTVNIFNEPMNIKANIIKGKKTKRKEDEEFLKKLSPSIKKKENMLCYFKKVEKEPISSPDIVNESCDINNDVAIKIELSTKSKKKVKKKKLSINKAKFNEKSELTNDLKEHNQIVDIATIPDPVNTCKNNSDRRKRKRNVNMDENTAGHNENTASHNKNIINSLSNDNLRPKRNIKKPVKYLDDTILSSSDEELHIFTPKKKKHIENKHSKSTTDNIDVNRCPTDIINTEQKESITKLVKEKKKKGTITQVKSIKLAPIFAVKPQIDPAVIEAKQKFLHSGVPDKLKKIITEQKSKYIQLSTFPTVVHVQQKSDDTSLTLLNIDLNDNDSDNDFPMTCEETFFSCTVDVAERIKNTAFIKGNIFKDDISSVLQNIKQMHPKFPVYRTYRSLKEKSRGEFKDYSYAELDKSIEVMNGMIDINNQNPDQLNWTDKYKPMSTKQIVGNFETIKELRKWLVTWTENKLKSKSKASFDSDSSDFYQSDTDSKDSIKSTNNLLVITGPVGSGKTSCVYAVAAELAMKVIEVNTSSKRTGKIMLQDLQEATQSHKVNRGKSGTESSQQSQEVTDNSKKKLKKKGRPKKLGEKSSTKGPVMYVKNESLSQSQSFNSQESIRTEMSLILVDDADVVFEQDDGFCSAIVQLVQCSKRPVILITSSTSCPHLQRFLQSSKIVYMRPLLPRILGSWLDLMCIVDNGICLPGMGAKFLDYFQGDMRKTINYLQFYISSQKPQEYVKENDSNNENVKCLSLIDDESSNMSWADHDTAEVKLYPHNLEDNIWKQFLHPELHFLVFKYPLNLYTIWWSIPSFLNLSFQCSLKDRQECRKESGKLKRDPIELNVVAKIIDTVSMSDYFGHKKVKTSMDMTSQPWFSVESDSVSENETLCNYNRNHELTDEISHKLITGSIEEAQRILELESSVYLKFPSMAERRERDRVVSRHNNLTSYLNPSAVLDRRALALDFWPSCRSICRIEKGKTDNNSKRNNRFCHYLKSVNVLCNSDSLDRLGDSLSPTSNIASNNVT